MSNIIIRKSGADLVVEVTAIDNNGNGVTAGLTTTVSIERMSDNNFWNSVSPAFDSAPEIFDPLVHVRNGLYAFVLVGGAELVYLGYRVHIVITGNPQVNMDAVIADVIETEPPAAGGDATIANQATILLNQTAIALQNAGIDAKTANLPADPASDTNVNDNKTKINTILSTGGAGPWTSAAGGNVTLEDNAANRALLDQIWDALRSAHITGDTFGENVNADIIKIGGMATVDGVSMAKWASGLLAYMQGRFRVNFPVDGDITFYERDNTTVAFVMHLTKTERTRVS